MSLDRLCLIHWVFGSALLTFVACPCFANVDAEDYERGVKLLEESRQQREFERRNELLGEAETAFRTFLRENPKHLSAYSARTQVGNILVERARMQLERTRRGNGNVQPQARGLYEQAYQNFEKMKADLAEELSKLRHIDSGDREKQARRDQLRAEYLQSQLLMAAVLEESADTYDARDARRQEVLAKAANEYREISGKYRSRLAGYYAFLYEGRCFKKCGKCEEALQRLGHVLDLPDELTEYSALKTKALNLALECWLDDSQKEYGLATTRGDEWLKRYGDRAPESRDWLELRFRLARAHLLLIESLDDIQQIATHREKAKALAEFVRRREGTFQVEARKLLAEIGDDNVAAGPPEPTSFAEAKAAGGEVLNEIKEMRTEIARQGISAVAVDIVPDLETIDAKPDPLQLKLKQKQVEAIRHYQLAQKLADDQTPKEDVDVVRYFLCYLYYSDGAYEKAAELGDKVARSPDASVGARQCAKIALASYMQIYQLQPPKSEKACGVVKELEALADHILETWPEEPEADEALDVLVPVLIREDRFDDSAAYLQRMSTDSPRRNQTALRVGAALWKNHLLGAQRLRSWERDGGPEPETDIEAVKKQVAKTKEQAKAILSDAIQHARDSKNITREVVMAALSLVQIHVESGEFERAVTLLEDPKIGPLTLVQGNHPAAQRPTVAREIYTTAIRVYEAVGNDAKATPLRELLK